MGPFAGLATMSSGVALRAAVLFVLVGNTCLLTPTGVLSECSLLMGRVSVIARRKKENISYRVLIFHAKTFRSDGE